jgi:uncharacterized protein YwgA
MQKAAVITRLIDKLRDKGSWCGETHVQKSIYFLQELLGVPFEYGYLFYKYGPFSFDLRDELTGFRADFLLELEPQRSYGPKIKVTEYGKNIQKYYGVTLKKYDRNVSFIAEKFGEKGVTELERLATAYFVKNEGKADGSIDQQARRIMELKPHIPYENAVDAVHEVDQIISEASFFLG